MALVGAPRRTGTGQRESWSTEVGPNPTTVRGGISGPVYLGEATSKTEITGTLTPDAQGVNTRSVPVDMTMVGRVQLFAPLLEAISVPESLLYKSIPPALWQRIRKWVRNDEASGATIPGRGVWSTALNEAAVTGAVPTSPIPIPVDDYISELVYRWYEGMGSYRFEDIEHGGEAAQIVADIEIARQDTRAKMQVPHQNRLTASSLLPTSPTLSAYQQVIGTGGTFESPGIA